MKELELLGKDKLEVKQVAPIKKEKTILASYNLKRGHTCFEFNTVTKELVEAQYEEVAIEYPSFDGLMDKRRKIVWKDDCIYVCALNKKNAIKKLLKAIGK